MQAYSPISKHKFECKGLIINPGDWGKRILPYGRYIDRKYVSNYKKVWNEVATTSVFRFIKKKDGTFICIDGQHRCTALSEVAEEKKTPIKVMLALFYDEEQFKTADSIAKLIVEVNDQRKQSLSNRLEAYKHTPGFFQDFVATEPRISFKNNTKTIQLTALLDALMLNKAIRENAPIVRPRRELEEYLVFIESLTQHDLLEITQFIDWWLPLCLKMHDNKMNTFKSASFLTAAFMVWRHNKNDAQLDKLINKFVKYPGIDRARLYSYASKWRECVNFIVEVFNYQSRSNFIKHPIGN